MIAVRPASAYGAPMPANRLLRFLAMLALLLAPLGMNGRAVAASHDASAAAMPAMADGHCPDMGGDSPQYPEPDVSCTIACAALPAIDATMPVQAVLLPPQLVTKKTGDLHGFNPEADPPPPRTA
ncbi:MAG: hypothetical protein ACT4OE_00325 [Sphingosinicella sp.]